MPTLIVWGADDPIIPASHGQRAHEAMPGSQLAIFPGAGHMPHFDDPLGIAHTLLEFMETTEPANVTPERWRELLVAGG